MHQVEEDFCLHIFVVLKITKLLRNIKLINQNLKVNHDNMPLVTRATEQ